MDLNHRPPGHEPGELPSAPPCNISISKKRTSPATNLPPIIDRWGRLREKCADTVLRGHGETNLLREDHTTLLGSIATTFLKFSSASDLLYYKSIANKIYEYIENKGFLFEWGSRGPEFESRHSDQKVAETCKKSQVSATFFVF